MSQKQINRSSDIKRLRDEGYEVEVRQGHLLVHSVPYVNAQKQVRLGTLVSELSLAGDTTVKPATHVINFQGEYPCSHKGVPIEQIRHNSSRQTLAGGIEIDHSFSNKPNSGYPDYYAKVTQYANIISHPAKALDATADPRTFKAIGSTPDESVFQYIDTASSRAGIQAISEKLSPQRVAIVGLGGTGSYILDFVAKTPVREIHLFDADKFYSHNAFRAPGAASIDDLRLGEGKVDYWAGIYSRMHSKIVPHQEWISEENAEQLAEYDFVFLCVDEGACKKSVFEALASSETVIIDVGMDVLQEKEKLLGTCRVTTCTKSKRDHVAKRISMGERNEDAAYASNIQIAELNAINACFAVIKWKQLSEFFQDLENEHELSYSTNCGLLVTDEIANEI